MVLNFKYIFFLFCLCTLGCGSSEELIKPEPSSGKEEEEMEMEEGQDLVEGVDYFLPNIDLNNWKVTLPIGNPTEVKPPAILDYATDPLLQEYMYNDSLDGSLVFYTSPGSTTTNSKYSRTELREQMEPGSNNVNWTFGQGGVMKGELKVSQVSGSAGNLDRIIVMQIHGRLTNAQRDLINEDDNNAPPVLKIYWDDGKINVRRKVLKDINVDHVNILKTDAWTDESHWFDKWVGFENFILEIKVSKSSMEVILNDGEERIFFDDIHMEKWNIFENYFKAGNYLQSTNSADYSEVRYYSLVVMH